VLLFGAWASTAFYRHVDVSDASLYRVIARHLVEDDAWVSLRYLPSAYPRFYEHLPFGLWPMAVVIRFVGEPVLPVACVLLGAATVVLVGRAGRQLAGEGAGLLAAASLALTQNFFFLSTLTLLDGPLLFGAALALVGLTRPKVDAGFVLLTFAGTLIGVATKGPFGLLTPVAMVGARAVVERSGRVLLGGSAAMAAAVAPVVLFVAASPDWLEGYWRYQVLGSVTGARTDGDSSRTFAVESLLMTCWPALAAFPLGLAPLRRRLAPGASLQPVVMLMLAAAALTVGLSLPSRKVLHHVFVAFPLMSVAAGVVLGPAVDRLVARRGARPVLGVLGVLLLAGLVAGPLGVAKLFCGPPCSFSTTFAGPLRALPAGTDIEVVTADAPWPQLSALSAEHRLVPAHVSALGASGIARWAVVQTALWSPAEGWVEVASDSRFVLVRRQ
jgi:4-amino-4-deoxy-L-arabinose transferase-like glycosyltransferase